MRYIIFLRFSLIIYLKQAIPNLSRFIRKKLKLQIIFPEYRILRKRQFNNAILK